MHAHTHVHITASAIASINRNLISSTWFCKEIQIPSSKLYSLKTRCEVYNYPCSKQWCISQYFLEEQNQWMNVCVCVIQYIFYMNSLCLFMLKQKQQFSHTCKVGNTVVAPSTRLGISSVPLWHWKPGRSLESWWSLLWDGNLEALVPSPKEAAATAKSTQKQGGRLNEQRGYCPIFFLPYSFIWAATRRCNPESRWVFPINWDNQDSVSVETPYSRDSNS